MRPSSLMPPTPTWWTSTSPRLWDLYTYANPASGVVRDQASGTSSSSMRTRPSSHAPNPDLVDEHVSQPAAGSGTQLLPHRPSPPPPTSRLVRLHLCQSRLWRCRDQALLGGQGITSCRRTTNLYIGLEETAYYTALPSAPAGTQLLPHRVRTSGAWFDPASPGW